MQFRVIAQGAAVGALTAGMMYTLYNNHFAKKPAINEVSANKHWIIYVLMAMQLYYDAGPSKYSIRYWASFA